MRGVRGQGGARWLSAAVTAAVAVVVGGASGCVRDEAMAGMGLPRLSADEQVAGDAVPFQGTLEIGPQGCLMVRLTDPAGDTADRWTAWPSGSEAVYGSAEEGNGAKVDRETFMGGDAVSGTGRLVPLSALPGGISPGSYFEGSGRYCDALVGGVLVIDEVAHA
ncbi:hypothetical protein SAMN06264364_11141 [Quadrisphaera granulorum]|uniref:Uncharacterized protein n=1 Tax=Quadrisphaera granulorum TaxID=317664 RepID=A0A316A8V0_9ACTN|nr:hypothetical protein [Quadrisphaera granulorum]PWJ53638.1 hypothetical protein BXY45_11141 [Quadrisphaera granulorum]SZE96682.1 hypothetical protein SAMN06264364_11141 [Quadrisphaera granulorum]